MRGFEGFIYAAFSPALFWCNFGAIGTAEPTSRPRKTSSWPASDSARMIFPASHNVFTSCSWPMDMGLGKTLQTLAWLAWLRENTRPGRETVGPSLVVCPKSVMHNWRVEAERFYPSLRVRLWRGESSLELSAARRTADLVIINNYAQLRLLSPAIAEHPMRIVTVKYGPAPHL